MKISFFFSSGFQEFNYNKKQIFARIYSVFYLQQKGADKTEEKSFETNFNNITKVIKCAAAAFGVSTINLTRGLKTNKTFTVLCFSVFFFCWRRNPFMYFFYKPTERPFISVLSNQAAIQTHRELYERNKYYSKGSIRL